jgi:hypothetical protein
VDVYVTVGTVLALVLIAIRCVGPHEWKNPKKWRVPDHGAAFIVLLGCNALTSAVKIFLIVAHDDLRVQSAHGLEKLGSEDVVLFIGGALAAFLVGLSTIRTGWREV